MTNDYDIIIEECGRKVGLDTNLIRAIINTESSWNNRAYRFEPAFYDRYIKGKLTTHKYYDKPEIISASYGLMQLMFTTAEELGFVGTPEELYDPGTNIRLGCMLLRRNMNLYGYLLGILAYNGGKPKVEDPRKAHNYVYLQKVAKAYKKYDGKNQTILDHAS